MATPSAEIIISPDLDPEAMRHMIKLYHKAFEKVSDDAEKQIAEGTEEGAKKGASRAKKALGILGKGAGLLAGGIATVALAGVADAMARAEEGRDTISGLLEESSAANSLSAAQATGLTNNQFGQFSAQLRNIGGLQDQTAINDVLQDLSIRVTEAAVEPGTQILEDFTQFSGQERINRVMASLSQVGEEQRLQTLDELGFTGEDGRALNEVIRTAGQGRTGSEAYEYLNEAQKTEGQLIAENLEKEATLAKAYRDKQLAHNAEVKDKLLNEINLSSIEGVFEFQKTEAERQVKNLQNFEENNQLAITTAEATEKALGTLNEGMGKLVVGVGKLVDKADKFFSGSLWDKVTGAFSGKGQPAQRYDGSSTASDYTGGR